MSAAEDRAGPLQSSLKASHPLDSREIEDLFSPFLGRRTVLLAVSGGPDSTALVHLAALWRRSLSADGPFLRAATVDHGLRPEAAHEAEAVAAFCARIGVGHATLRWQGPKPGTGLQEAARAARYDLLLDEARAQRASALALAHTLDDQAETVLFRLARGSGLSGLAAMRAESVRGDVALLRPFLGVPKARLVATLKAEGVAFLEDPTNRDPRFTRPRLRAMAPLLEAEGLSAARLGLLARRVARAEAALEAATDEAALRLLEVPLGEDPLCLDLAGFLQLPAEIGLRLLGRAVDAKGHEGPVELAKLEALFAALVMAGQAEPAAFRRTLAGALVTIRRGEICVTGAPERRKMRSSR